MRIKYIKQNKKITFNQLIYSVWYQKPLKKTKIVETRFIFKSGKISQYIYTVDDSKLETIRNLFQN